MEEEEEESKKMYINIRFHPAADYEGSAAG